MVRTITEAKLARLERMTAETAARCRQLEAQLSHLKTGHISQLEAIARGHAGPRRPALHVIRGDEQTKLEATESNGDPTAVRA